MPLSVQGHKVLAKMLDSFRIYYVNQNPSVNMNDVERAFLKKVRTALVRTTETFTDDDLLNIDIMIHEIQ